VTGPFLRKTISRFLGKVRDEKVAVEKAVQWAKRVHRVKDGKIEIQSGIHPPSQETTGYMIPTLYNFGERDLAIELARWEASCQGEDGSSSAVDGVPYTFDTAQVIRGYLAVLDDVPELEGNLRRACEFVVRNISSDGEVCTPSYDLWQLPDGSMLHEYGNLYVLPPMLQAGRKLSEKKYVEAATRGMDCFRRKKDLVEFKPELSMLSHYFGYMMEALVDLGEFELAKKGLAQAAVMQKANGAIPAYSGVDWVCSTGMAQLALAWYKLGHREPADRALAYLVTLQNVSGGFYGSYGRGAAYFQNLEINYAVKFFLDACYWKIKTDFDLEVDVEYLTSIDEGDGRVNEILSFLGDLNAKCVVDVGCGKGRFLRVLKSRFPKASLYGLDISDEMLRSCPPEVNTICASMLNIKQPDGYFDCVYSVEALEHAVRIELAIKEMVRVLKPGGKIIIIDKNNAKAGALQIKSWEQWFDAEGVANLLRKYGVNATFKYITYDQWATPDGLFIAWEGIKAG